MPDLAEKLHLRWTQRIVFWKGEFGWEDASLVRCLFGSWDVSLPDEHVCIVEGAGEDAFGLRLEDLVGFVAEAFAGYGCGHGRGPIGVKCVWGEDSGGKERKKRIEELVIEGVAVGYFECCFERRRGEHGIAKA
jgi:hypothetical protein